MQRPLSRLCHKHGSLTAVVAALSLLCVESAQGQKVAENRGRGEFPALQFLPPGSILRGISLPRYEEHRVTSLFTADKMEVKSRSLVLLMEVRAHLYDKDGGITDMESGKAQYDFAHARVTSPVPTSVVSPRMEAKGKSLVFDNDKHVGLLKGPVYTAIRSDNAGTAITPQKK